MSVLSARTRDDLGTVLVFFGIDRDSNLHLFRAANDFNRDSFATTMQALATAIHGDVRYRCDERVKAAIAADKAAREQKQC